MITNTQKMSDATETEIRKHPAQWVWMHERWKTKPGEEIPLSLVSINRANK